MEEKLEESEAQLGKMQKNIDLYTQNGPPIAVMDETSTMRDGLSQIDNGYLTINTCGTVSRNVSDVSFLRFLNDPMAALGQSHPHVPPETSTAVGVNHSPSSRFLTPASSVISEHEASASELPPPGAPPIPAKAPLSNSQNLLSVDLTNQQRSYEESSSLTPTNRLSPKPLTSPSGSIAASSEVGSIIPGGGPQRSNSPPQHKFEGHTLLEPTKCCHCVSLMLGTARQAVKCVSCSFVCHPKCVDKLQPNICPMPPEQMKCHLGIDPQTGIGTAYEGFVKIPRSGGGVKKGWVRQYAVTCDYKFFLFDCVESGNGKSPNGSGNMTGNSLSTSFRKTLKITECIDMKLV